MPLHDIRRRLILYTLATAVFIYLLHSAASAARATLSMPYALIISIAAYFHATSLLIFRPGEARRAIYARVCLCAIEPPACRARRARLCAYDAEQTLICRRVDADVFFAFRCHIDAAAAIASIIACR